ncbi:hypothetical protein FEE95_03900 [Maribacter algarum]|uniref:DUF3311 domain-containing protein n=1 Tax=Maribacter algarum (ex Zhang et al. 2020) TaxID=2578118 RepID=A0A5S3PWH9_9FLAO|nr:hypothetical protein [Maribacter algarum]TMM58582.1 hypothetical protein FEE95_03900 [Maribacter algarum]
MKSSKRTRLLLILDLIAIGLVIATFSPLVIPVNESNPSWYGIPFTLWSSFLISVLFVVLAYLVSLVNKEKKHAD